MTSVEDTIDFADLIIAPNESLRSALQRMTVIRKGILLVCDNDAHLVGIISDGDVRRTVLDNRLLVVPIHQVMNTDPITAETTKGALDAINRFGVIAVPVVGPDGTIIEIVVQDKDRITVLKPEKFSDLDNDVEDKSRNVVAIIPARGGSKRVPRKNLAMVGGKPLVAWAVLSAKSSRNIEHVVVSTDDAEIRDEVRGLGIEVPWLRPPKLAEDHTTTFDVVKHALEWALQAYHPAPEFAVLLEPTAPLRTSNHIESAIEILANSDADSVVSVCEVPHVFNPEELLVIDGEQLRPFVESRNMDTRRLRGQQRPAYVQNGLVYAFRIQTVLQQGSLYGQKTLPLVTSWEEFLDVDTPEDLQLADQKLRQLAT